MSMRDSILTALAEDLTDIDGIDPYEIDLKEVRRGITLLDDFNSMPAISFWCYDAGLDSRAMGGSTLKWLQIYFYGYTRSVTDIHKLEDDLEYFLENEFAYRDDSIIKVDTSLPIYESGITSDTDDVSMFRLDVKIKYGDTIYDHLVSEDGKYLITE